MPPLASRDATALLRASPRRRNVGLCILLLALVSAFLWQSVATATHLHLVVDTHAAAATRYDQAPQLRAPTSSPVQPIDCPLCHDAAIAGHFLSPGTILLAVPIAVAPWRQLTIRTLPRDGVVRSHAWRSRAPPAAAGIA